MANYELSVIIPTYGRSAKLRRLLCDIAATASNHDAVEVIVVVDELDDAPLEVGSVLPQRMHFVGLTKEHKGPAAARNYAIEHAQGNWLLSYDDDARISAHAIPGHLDRIRRDPGASLAYLGRVDWPRELIDAPWRVLLAETPMLFFWNHMTSGKTYNFRHFWTSNLSVRADAVRQVGGFCEEFPTAMHEDIELGWRLQQEFGLRVYVDESIPSLHDHAIDPRDYFLREHKSGHSARVAASINPPFHSEVWSWIDNPEQTLDTLQRLFTHSARNVVDMLESWAQPSDGRPSPDELHAAYLAHLPLKRMAFYQGYLERSFEEFWNSLRSIAVRHHMHHKNRLIA